VAGLERKANGMHLNLTFLGLELYEDYHLRLLIGDENVGNLIVESRDGSRAQYALHFSDVTVDGRVSRSVQVAGFDPTRSEELGWLKIGQRPVSSALTLDEKEIPQFKGMDDALNRLIQEKEMRRRLESGEAPRATDPPE
jgi:hypothetical protein